ncbi:MAG: energy transducer TonB [Pseudolabrys sp.]|jgi:protein TonB
MTVITADSYDLRRWVLSTAVVIGLHAALVVMLTTWHERVAGDEGTEAIIVDLAPLRAPPRDSRNDLAPGPEQQQSKSVQDVQPDPTPREKTELPPPVPDAEVKLPEEAKPPDKPKEEATPPVPETTSPPRPRPSAAQVASWHRRIAQQVKQHKGYPPSARARHETGTAQLAFTLDRNGKLITSRIVRTSGSATLDQETIDTVRRAQPFPPPPPNMPGETFDFTVPIRFNIR